MEEWQEHLRRSIRRPEDIAERFQLDQAEVCSIDDRFRIQVTPYYYSLIKEKNDPLYKQVIPDPEELREDYGCLDPLHEEEDSPVSSIIHRYPDRLLFLVTNVCASYCRFCTRKRRVDDGTFIHPQAIENGLQYIRYRRGIRDVIVSGGDPLILSDSKIEYILKSLREIPHVEIIRIGTRIPCFLPQRITDGLVDILKKYHPLYINVHFNHPEEITPKSSQALLRLANAGIPLGNQSVLLRGINDDPLVMKELHHKLLKVRVRPYYIYQADCVRGTAHLRTSVERGLEIMDSLRGWTSGIAVPQYVIDAPGGGGKIPLLPSYVRSLNDQRVILRNYAGVISEYPQKSMRRKKLRLTPLLKGAVSSNEREIKPQNGLTRWRN
jgi:lysine 2,3-aminomutase